MYLHSLCYRHTTVSFDISVKFYFTGIAPLVPGWYLVFFLFYIFKIPKRLTGIAVNLVECRLGNGDEQRLSCFSIARRCRKQTRVSSGKFAALAKPGGRGIEWP